MLTLDYNKHLSGKYDATNDMFIFEGFLIIIIVYSGFLRAEFTKKIVKPALGESGIGGSMAVYGAADAIVSSYNLFLFFLFCFQH